MVIVLAPVYNTGCSGKIQKYLSSPPTDFSELFSGNNIPPFTSINFLLNNVTLAGNEWIEALNNLSLSPKQSITLAQAGDLSKRGLPHSKRSRGLMASHDEGETSLSSYEIYSSRYFHRSHTNSKPTGGLGKE